MPDNKSRNYFENIVTGLNNLQKQIQYYERQNKANIALTKSTQRVNEALRRQNAALRTTVQNLRVLNNQTKITTRSGQLMGITWEGVARVIVGSLVSRGIQGLVNAFRDALSIVNEFEVRISEIRTLSQRSQQGFEQWASSVRNLSDAFGLPILDVAEAAYETLSNQVAEGAESFRFLNEAARLSRISNSSLADSVNLLSGVINAYGESVGSARRISDSFFKSVDLGRFRVEDIADSFGNVAILGKQLGVSFEELEAALATLTLQSIPPAEGMTFLRNTMINMIRPTEAMSEWLASIGATSAESAVEAYSFVGVMRLLAQHVENSNEPLSELGTLFGRIRGVLGAAGLTSAFNTFEDHLDQIKNSSEEANKAFEIMSESVGKRLQIELQKIANFFTVDLGRDAAASLDTLNTLIGGTADRLKDVYEILKFIGKALIGISFGLLITKTAAWIRGLTTVTALIGVAEIKVTGLSALLAIARTRILAIAAALAGWPALIIAAATALTFYAFRLLNIRKENTRHLKDIQSEEIDNYRQMIDEKISEELRLLEARVQASQDAAAANVRYFAGLNAPLRGTLNQMQALRFEIDAIDKILFRRRVEQAKPFDAAKLLIAEATRLLNLLPTKLELIEDPKEKLAAIKEVEDIIGRLEQLDGKRIKASNTLQTSHGKILMLGRSYGKAVLDTDKNAKHLNRTLDNILKKYRDSLGKAPEQEVLDNLRSQIEANDVIIQKLREQKDLTQVIGDSLEESIKNQLNAISEVGTGLITLKEALPSERFLSDLFTITPIKEDLDDLAQRLDLLSKKKLITDEDVVQVKEKFRQIYEAIREEKDRIIAPAVKEAVEAIFADLRALGDATREVKGLEDSFTNLQDQITDIAALAAQHKALTQSFAEANIESFEATKLQLDILSVSLQKVNALLQQNNTLLRENQTLRSVPGNVPQDYFGGRITRQHGGSIGKDSVPILAAPGEFIMNATAARKFLPQLVAMNSGAKRYDSGGIINNNVGDINLTVESSGNEQIDARTLGNMLRRELRRSTLRLS